MEGVQAYIGLRGSRNVNELADVPADKLDLYNTHYMKPVHFERQDSEDQVVRPAASRPRDGAAGGVEHRGVRGLLLRRLQHRLSPAGQGITSAGRADGGGAGGPHHRSGDRLAVLDRRHPRDPLRGDDEHPGWRGLHRPRPRFGQWSCPVQCADDLPRVVVRRRPPGIPGRADRLGRLFRRRRGQSCGRSSRRTPGRRTRASGRSGATRGS